MDIFYSTKKESSFKTKTLRKPAEVLGDDILIYHD